MNNMSQIGSGMGNNLIAAIQFFRMKYGRSPSDTELRELVQKQAGQNYNGPQQPESTNYDQPSPSTEIPNAQEARYEQPSVRSGVGGSQMGTMDALQGLASMGLGGKGFQNGMNLYGMLSGGAGAAGAGASAGGLSGLLSSL